MMRRLFVKAQQGGSAAVSTREKVKNPMKWVMLMAVMLLLPSMTMAQTVLGAWTLSGSSVSRTISCGTTYTFTGSISSSTNSMYDSYCTISSSTSCPITVTLTARSLSTEDQDYVYVYDGSGTNGTLLDTWSQSTPTGLSVTSASGTITIRFEHNKKKRANSFTVRLYQSCSCATPSSSYSCTGGESSYQIGSGTSSSVTYGPVNNFYNRSYRQILYTSEEFDYRSGDIQAIAFQYAGSSAITHAGDVTVYMANTNVQQFASPTSWITSGLTQVYHGNMNFQSSGWAWITLDSPFSYTGGNLLMVIDDNSGIYDGSGCTFNYSGASSGPTMQLYQQSDLDTCNFSNTSLPTSGYAGTNYRPNTKFCIEHNCDVRPDNFAFANENVTVTAGQTYTQNVTGGQNVTYTMTCNPTGIATFNATTHAVTTVAGQEGTVTVTAKWPASDGYCDKYASYVINVGDGCSRVGNESSTTSYAPVYTWLSGKYGYTQQLYKASEILAAGACQGVINSIKFQYQGPSTYANLTMPIEVYVGTTSATSLADSWVTDGGLTLVYSGSYTFVSGWNTINLSTHIEWDGVSNIVVAVRTMGTISAMDYYFYGSSATSLTRYCYGDASISLNARNVPSSEEGTAYGTRPNIKFCIDCCTMPDFSFAEETVYCVNGGACAGQTISVNQSGGTVTYESSNTSVATVNSTTGAINVRGAGTTTITARVTKTDDYCATTATYTLIVQCGTTPHTITYNTQADCNEGTASPATWTYTGTTTTITSTIPVCSSANHFVGWYANTNGTGTRYTAGQAIDLTCGDMTLYAVYSHEPDTIEGSGDCEDAQAFCASNDEHNGVILRTATGQDSPAGMCSYFDNPSWWYLQISQAGRLEMTIASDCGDVDFGCWGPFRNFTCHMDSLSDNAATETWYTHDDADAWGLTGATSHSASSSSTPICVIDALAYPCGNLVDFSAATDRVEYLQIDNAQVGDIYVVLVANWANCEGTISFTQTNLGANNAGMADCEIVANCDINVITTHTTPCNTADNTYTVSGEIYFIEAPTSGTLTITDETANPPVSQVFNAPFTSPTSYSLQVPSDGATHHLGAAFSATDCTKPAVYQAPDPCVDCSSSVTHTDVTCHGANDGTITLTSTNGRGWRAYYIGANGSTPTLSDSLNATSYTWDHLAPGTYTVFVRDTTNCKSEQTVVVQDKDAVTLSLTTPTTGQCPLAAGSNYAVTANPAGGTGTYQSYSWSVLVDGVAGTISGTGNNATIASDGSCHDYVVSLSLTDGNGCQATATKPFSTSDNVAPTISTTATNNYDWGCDPATVTAPTFTATDACAGTLVPTVVAGTVQNTGTCTRKRTWTANVSDNCGNAAVEKSITYTWTESQVPTIGAIANQNATMGTSGCKYKMIDLEAVTMAVASDPCGGTVEFVSQSVAVGTEYTQTNVQQTIPVTVTVRGTCNKTATATVNVIIPAKDITVDITNAGASVCAGGDTVLTAVGSSSNGALTYAWTPTTGLTPTTGASVTATVSTETTYTVTATDPAGCTATDQITVTINPEVTLNVSNQTQTKCLGAAITDIDITVTNGTISNATALQTALAAIGLTYNNGHISGTPNAFGTHTFEVVAVSNQTPQCSQQTETITLNITNLITPVISGDEDICVTASEQNTQLTLAETAGDNSFTYTWNVDGGTIVSGQNTNSIVAEWAGAGDKTVTVTLALDGCSAQATKTIHVRPAPVATINEITDEICPNAGTIDITGNTTVSNPNYTYNWSGTLTLDHNTATVAATSDVVTATIPGNNCNTTYQVRLNVVDNYNCKNTATPITITVKDDQAPVASTYTLPDKDVEGCNYSQLATLYPAVTTVAALEAEATALGGALTISDNCTTDKAQLALSNTETYTGRCPIVVTRKYKVTDLCGKVSNEIVQTIRINVADNITIATATNASGVECVSEARADLITPPTVTDACGTTLLPLDGSPVANNQVTGCNGTVTYTYNYKDCAEHPAQWVYTYTVTHPNLTVPNDSISPISCLTDTSNTFVPVSLTDDCGNTVTAVLVGAPDMSGYNASTNTGNVVFNYRYTDCAGQTYPWTLTYEIVPSAFTETPSGASTVSCISQATPQEPAPRMVCGEPITYVADANNPIDAPADIEANGGCGTRTYRYTYTVNGTDYVWNYVYTIRPDSIVFEGNVATRDTVECDDPAFTPTLPTVKTNCGIDITSSATVVTGGTYTDCEGTKTWTYTFTDCTGRTRNWTYTRVIDRVTAPHQEGEVDTASTVECLASTMTPPAALPVVKDVCGNTLTAPTPRIDSTWNGCTGQKTYTYVYEDCAGLRYVWRYHYDIERTGDITEDGHAPTETEIHCINDTVRPAVMPVIKDICGNILQPRIAMPDPVISLTGCVGTVTYTYSYTDCAGKNYQWSYVNRIVRSEKPHIVTAGGTPTTVDCQNLAVAESITLPVVVDQCGVTLDAPVPVITNNWTTEPCNGTRTFTYNYTDCADSVLKWEYTYTISHPGLTVPTDSVSPIPCLSDTSNTFVPVPLTDACGNTATAALEGAPDMSGYNASTNTGEIVFNYQYTDCAGQTYPWKLTYEIVPSAFTETPSGASTVSCISQATPQEPAPRMVCGEPITYVADANNPIDAPADIEANGGCGTRTYRYTYTVNGTDYVWNYVYTIRPDSIVFEGNVATRDTVECDDPAFTPTLPTVKTNCGIDITSSATVTTGGTYDGCEGTKTWNYTFTDCTGRTRAWNFTRVIDRVTAPHQEGEVDTASTVECLASTMTPPAALPVVKDVCGNTLTAPTPRIDSTWNGCTGQKTYTYVYEDCAGLRYVWRYHYDIERTGDITEEGSAATEIEIHCINDTVRPAVMPVIKDVCGNILQPRVSMPDPVISLTGCVGTVTYTYSYTDCAGKNYQWSYVNRIVRSEKPHIVTAGGTPRSVICQNRAVADSITLPVVSDQCGVTLDAPVPVVTNNWTSEPCEGTRTFTYNYTDCADSVLKWEYTFTIDLPSMTMPGDSISPISCLADTSNTFVPVSLTDTCGNTVPAALVGAPDMSGYDDVNNTGDVVFNYQYTDCAGQTYPWKLTYRVVPDAFTETPGGASTVSCISQAMPQEPAPRTVCGEPVGYVADPNNPIDAPADIEANGGCGTRTYRYTYNVNGTDYVWNYVYTIRPDSIVFEGNVATRDTVECDDPAFTPTLPTVKTNCGIDITSSATVVTGGTYTDCEGTKTWTYTFSDCTGRTRNWSFTRWIRRVTPPHQEGNVEDAQNVECLASTRVAPTVLPEVKDVCGNTLPAPQPVIDSTWDGCTGEKTYTYTYEDCAGLTYVWHYTYNIVRTGGIHEEGTAPTETVVHCINDTVRPAVMPVIKDTCGNILQPLDPMPAATLNMTGCVGTVTFTYNYEDCAGQTYEWSYVNRIERSEKPHIVTDGGMPRTVDCEGYAVVDSITLPVIADQCGVTLDAPVPVVTNDWNTEPCNGTRTFTYNYTDCADSVLTWVYTFTIDMPASEPLAAGAVTVLCEGDALENAIQFPTHNFACGTSHTISAADRTAAPTVDITNGAGTVTYHYEYSDCEGNLYTWDFVYTVSPNPLTLPEDQYDTVYCVASVNMPTPAPLLECGVNLFEGVVPEYESTMSDGCGDTIFVFRYHANGADTAWRYHYHVEPADFTLPADGSVNVQCYNDEQPDAAIVPVVAAGNGICEAINPSTPVRNADGTDTYDGCEGTVSYTYTYSNCKYSHSWKYTYNVQRTTVPQVSDVATSSNITCADLADGTFTMPTVTDACGVEIPAPTPVISGNPVNCNGTKVYTYTYTDCTGRLTSTFTYTYNINDNVSPTIGTVAQQNATLAGNCQYTIPDLQAMVMAVTTDNCSTPQWVSQEPAAGTVYASQTTATTVPVVVTVKDECNNTKTAIVNVIVPANSLNLPTIAGVSICEGDAATLTAAPTSNNTPVVCNWTTGTTTVATNTNSITVDPTTTTTYMVTATDAAGCSTNRTAVVTVNHPTDAEFTQTVCEGYTWTNHGWSQTYNVSGDYTHNYTSAQGCPSTDVLHLTVYHNTNTEYTETACDTYTWTNHGLTQTYTTSGNYQHNYTTAEGCPSTDVLHLTVNNNSNTTYTETVCDSYTWNNHGWSQEYTASGTYTHAYMSAEGCPSTDVLTLTVNQSGTGSLYVTQCEEYTWYGANYNTSGDYQHHLTTVRGCDSLVTLHLTIINSYYVDLYDTVCFGANYTWYGNTYTQPGDYEHLLVSQNGCDSTLTMHLYQLPVVRVGIDAKPDCHTGSYKLTVSSINSDQYEWWSEPDNGDLASQLHETEVTVTPLVNTTYYAKAWAAGHEECAASTSLKLEPVKIPRAAIDAHPSYLTIDRTDWNATDRSVGGTWRMWYVDGEYYSGDPHISGQIVPAIDSLELVLIIGTDDCADTAHRTIPYKNVGLWVPNVFTPAQDNNNFFGAEGSGIKDYEMWVYTREGLLVFHSESMNDRWDGKHKGENCPQGTYTYRIAYTTVAEPESEMEVVGTVTILR